MKHPAVALGEIADLIRGITYKPTDVCDTSAASAVACMRTKNVQEALDESDIVWIPDSLIRNPAKYLKPGDILVSSANSWNLVGKGCWVPELKYAASAGGFISILRGNPDTVDLRYLYHWFVSPQTQAKLRSYSNKTTNISNLDHGRTLATEIPLPPLEEQRRIAAILDKRHSLEEKIRRRVALHDDLWKAEFIKRFGNPFAHQSRYPLAKIAELASTSSGGTPRREVRSYFGGSIPWVKSGELSNPIVESTEEFLTEEGLDNSSAKILDPGVVLLAMYGATAGAVSILGIPASTNQAICAIDAHDRLDSIYLADYLRLITPALLAKRIGGAQPNLTQDIIRNILIPVSDEDSQRSYVSIRRQMANVEACFSSSLLAVSRLGASFSRQAFALSSGL